ncbi:LysM peptidoglycan-binding domain-containing protein [Streptomyces roseirectus]|uniref:LysM peptidoglycan-binding domain-containing protein n=1 Tax=Streptomyces roseirectus TaxID=2768066 RepID=A0A7H0IHJ7_9ACTN|nr:transglycosylase family protein [Streptomyces roseirectus]QNP72263.1 LysM peptidoglycan-binding domain-containing protein [Streptomyces roseirectus]
MLSGNGRHRRPRQAPALLVAAGVTGTAIAIPLLGASGASAADGSAVWDKVAGCETDGDWSENTGSGKFGGLHLTLDDWQKYGGLQYAERPDLASRAEQMTIAQKVLADQGPGAWPVCALTTGLTKENGSVALDTPTPTPSPSTPDSSGTSGSSGSSGTSDSSKGSGATGSSGQSGTTDPAAPKTPATPTPSTSPSPSPAPVDPDASSGRPTGEVPGDSAGGDKSDTSGNAAPNAPQVPDSAPTAPATEDNPVQSAGSWSLVDTGAGASDEAVSGASPLSIGTGKHRGASGDEPTTYTVRVGDTLTSIADSLALDGGWRALYAANKGVIGVDPSDIVPGQTLSLGN